MHDQAAVPWQRTPLEVVPGRRSRNACEAIKRREAMVRVASPLKDISAGSGCGNAAPMLVLWTSGALFETADIQRHVLENRFQLACLLACTEPSVALRAGRLNRQHFFVGQARGS